MKIVLFSLKKIRYGKKQFDKIKKVYYKKDIYYKKGAY